MDLRKNNDMSLPPNSAIKSPSRYYRVLTPDLKIDGALIQEGTFTSWSQGRRTSTHSRIPGDWLSTWKSTRSEAAEDYSRFADGVEYTEEALGSFLKHVREHFQNNTWTPELQRQVGAYYGVSAFDNHQAALRYADRTPQPYFVVFEGTLLGQLPPEAEGGGVRVQWIRDEVGPVSLTAFQEWLRNRPSP